MKKRSYERLDIKTFGGHLLATGDLDPIYIALVRMGMEREKTKRWMVAYWAYYHAGVASYLSEFEGEDYWDKFRIAAENVEESPTGDRWERGHERRHYRAANAMKSYEDLSSRYRRPEDMVDYIVFGDSPTSDLTLPLAYKDVTKRAQNHVGFGPWIGFKVADMLDRVLNIPVEFATKEVFLFKDPKQAALMLWAQQSPYGENAKPKEQAVIDAVVGYLTEHFAPTNLAPPFYDRPVNVQEIETILCKWKSHMNGHYPLNNDLDDIKNGLNNWAMICPTAAEFRSYMP